MEPFADFKFKIIRAIFNTLAYIKLNMLEELTQIELIDAVTNSHSSSEYVEDELDALRRICINWWTYKDYFEDDKFIKVLSEWVTL